MKLVDKILLEAANKPGVYTVYHGTNQPFSKFDVRRGAMGTGWFSDSKDEIMNGNSGAASSKYIMVCKIKILNPAGWDEYEKYGLGQLKSMGYDGIILRSGDGTSNYVVFKNSQVKVVRELKESIEGRKEVPVESLPDNMYHVTTNLPAVKASGYLKAMKGFDNGGLGGTESVGVSLIPDLRVATGLKNELILLTRVNKLQTPEDGYNLIKTLDPERAEYVLKCYQLRLEALHESPQSAMIMAVRESRNARKFTGKPFHGLLIFFEGKITMPESNIGIITVKRENINSKVIEGIDRDIQEVRVLGNIKI